MSDLASEVVRLRRENEELRRAGKVILDLLGLIYNVFTGHAGYPSDFEDAVKTFRSHPPK